MSDAAAFWNPRFARPEYLYGTHPNDFLREQASQLPPGGRVLSLGEGEGRNAVFLAENGHTVSALDISQPALDKLAALAAARGVAIAPVLADLEFHPLQSEFWDAIVSIFCHLHTDYRAHTMRRVVGALKPGGIFLLEAYTPRQLAFGTGGPKDPALLYEPEELRAELDGLEIIRCAELERPVQEGLLHTGMAAVVQIVARKPCRTESAS